MEIPLLGGRKLLIHFQSGPIGSVGETGSWGEFGATLPPFHRRNNFGADRSALDAHPTGRLHIRADLCITETRFRIWCPLNRTIP